MSDFEQRIAAYLAHRMPNADAVTVDEFARIHGGSSQETYRLRARWKEGAAAIERRLDPTARTARRLGDRRA